MKKALLGLVAIGTVLALLPLATRTGEMFRAHVRQMALQCTQMARQCREMAAQLGARGQASR